MEQNNTLETELATGEREVEPMKLSDKQERLLGDTYLTLSQVISLGIDIENDKLTQAAENLQDIIDTL